MNAAPDHHFHGHPERRFTLDGIRDELCCRRQPRPRRAEHWQQPTLLNEKEQKNVG